MKCIYCNKQTDMTVSDIIPSAITGAKLKKKFVCRTHNSFTNDHYEKTIIQKLATFRNRIELLDFEHEDKVVPVYILEQLYRHKDESMTSSTSPARWSWWSTARIPILTVWLPR